MSAITNLGAFTRHGSTNVQKLGLRCRFHPCPLASRRPYKSHQGLRRHYQLQHPFDFQRHGAQIIQETRRSRGFGGMRALTGAAIQEYQVQDRLQLDLGQSEMDISTQRNQDQFEPEIAFEQLNGGSYDNNPNTFEQLTFAAYNTSNAPQDELDRTQAGEYEVARREEHPTAGRKIRTLNDEELLFPPKSNIFHPFNNNSYDFKLGAWLNRGNATDRIISGGFNSGLLRTENSQGEKASFTSAHTLNARLDQLEPELGEESWTYGKAMFWADDSQKEQPFYFRDPATIIQHFFKQPAFRDHLVYKPVKEFNSQGRRIYSEISSADWWWEAQVSFRSVCLELRSQTKDTDS